MVALKTHPRNENDQNDFDHNDHFDRHTMSFQNYFLFEKFGA